MTETPLEQEERRPRTRGRRSSGPQAPGTGSAGLLERWTRAVVRLRVVVLAAWAGVLVVGLLAAGRLSPLLATSFAVPGTESDEARLILGRDFGERPDGTFTVVQPVESTRDEDARRAFARHLARAATAVPTGVAGEVRDGTGLLYGSVGTSLPLHAAKQHTDAVRRALAQSGAAGALVTGQPAIQHDVEPVMAADLRRGQIVALVVALVVLLAVLGPSLAVAVPFAFAACAIAGTLALVTLVAQRVTMATYVTNLVELIGLGLAVDYSLLVLLRFREELRSGGETEDAVVRTIATAGRTALFSGAAVAIGLGLLLLLPVPLIRSMGVAGLAVPLVAMVAIVTLQPALLSLLGRRGSAPLSWRRPTQAETGEPAVDTGRWGRIATAIARRPVPYLVVGVTFLVVAALPALAIDLTPGSLSGVPATMESSRGYALLREGVGPGVVTPTSVVVDARRAGGADREDVTRAIDRLGDRLFQDFDLVALGSGTKPPYVDESRRFARLIAAGRAEFGAPETRELVRRLRERDIPASRFPADVRVVTGGAPAQGVDFLARSYAVFPWIVLVAVVVTYVVLLRAFRSLVIPLKAVVLNTLTVAATYGLLVVVFQWGVGAETLRLRAGEIEGWVPIFLFAVLFGLSMDYEVFIVSRMREAWDELHDNTAAIAFGLARTGKVVTAGALIMVGAFAGFVAGRVAGLQQLGVGLSIAVLLDATLVRGVLVPAAMAVLGRWNWWLPPAVARLVRVRPSPLELPPELTQPG